jgi:hypothetical protein
LEIIISLLLLVVLLSLLLSSKNLIILISVLRRKQLLPSKRIYKYVKLNKKINYITIDIYRKIDRLPLLSYLRNKSLNFDRKPI